uniref:NADH:ubiquinone reductase (H(+)-translocating) n=1 Tax=Romanomermis iyengari TaxID=416168 RepID=A1Z3B7_ROMIY|nr:NADH dehydrogenase subunit 5 [Romanomermis iyengari]ABL73800.1 NADH dehydrogenase subunit 5 [Romanomermis iyengari]
MLNLQFIMLPFMNTKVKLCKISYFFNFEFSLMLMNLLFCVCLLSIFSNILKFSSIYMMGSKYNSYFKILMWMFCASMIILLLSDNFFLLILGWEFLGITSYYLILFYYNWNSLSGGNLTFISNRIGDCFIMPVFFLFIYMNSYFWLTLMILMLGMTKSAQLPFSVWLPAAMAAPTPVSALVHSSTLVTSGLYIFFKFKLPLMSMNLKKMMIFLGLLTLMMGSYAAFKSKDVKKIIAFSTLSQLGFLMISFSSLWLGLMMFHLLVHAFLKSFFFILFGLCILTAYSQNLNKIDKTLKSLSMMTMFYIVFLNFTSFFFTSMFISKEFMISNLMFKKLFFFVVYYIIMILTLFYMKRLYHMFLTKEFYSLKCYKMLNNFSYISIQYFFIFNFFSYIWMQNFLIYYCNSSYLNTLILLFIFFIYLNIKLINIFNFLNIFNNFLAKLMISIIFFVKEEEFMLMMKFNFIIFFKSLTKSVSLFIIMMILLSL